MTIRFAPARNRNALVRTIARGTDGFPRVQAANDNGPTSDDQELLAETLRHFAAHGLGAAERAKAMATLAARAGDAATYKHWLAVCRMLDKRMARALATKEEFAAL